MVANLHLQLRCVVRLILLILCSASCPDSDVVGDLEKIANLNDHYQGVGTTWSQWDRDELTDACRDGGYAEQYRTCATKLKDIKPVDEEWGKKECEKVFTPKENCNKEMRDLIGASEFCGRVWEFVLDESCDMDYLDRNFTTTDCTSDGCSKCSIHESQECMACSDGWFESRQGSSGCRVRCDLSCAIRYDSSPGWYDLASTCGSTVADDVAGVRCVDSGATECDSFCPDGDNSSYLYSEAVTLCMDAGLRLPTTEELDTSVCESTGCYFDWKLVWTSDFCDGCIPIYSPSAAPSDTPTAPTIPPLECALESEVCGCTGKVRYGVGSTFVEKDEIDGFIDCNNSVFGGDPMPGVAKKCYCIGNLYTHAPTTVPTLSPTTVPSSLPSSVPTAVPTNSTSTSSPTLTRPSGSPTLTRGPSASLSPTPRESVLPTQVAPTPISDEDAAMNGPDGGTVASGRAGDSNTADKGGSGVNVIILVAALCSVIGVTLLLAVVIRTQRKRRKRSKDEELRTSQLHFFTSEDQGNGLQKNQDVELADRTKGRGLLFWEAVERYEKVGDKNASLRERLGAWIMKEFVLEGSANEINLSAKLRSSMANLASKEDHSFEEKSFADAKAEIHDLLQKNFLQDYRASVRDEEEVISRNASKSVCGRDSRTKTSDLGSSLVVSPGSHSSQLAPEALVIQMPQSTRFVKHEKRLSQQ